jgi:hypothetical protein
MQPIFRVVVNWAESRTVACAEDVERLCSRLTGMPVFAVHVTGERGEIGPTLDVIVESGRSLVGFLDIECGVKQVSRNETCTERGIVSLRNDAYPELELDQIEVHRRDLISPDRAISILRHYLNTGATVDLVQWPPDDWDDWGDISQAGGLPDASEKDIPF